VTKKKKKQSGKYSEKLKIKGNLDDVLRVSAGEKEKEKKK
jgi:hypothetical protein